MPAITATETVVSGGTDHGLLATVDDSGKLYVSRNSGSGAGFGASTSWTEVTCPFTVDKVAIGGGPDRGLALAVDSTGGIWEARFGTHDQALRFNWVEQTSLPFTAATIALVGSDSGGLALSTATNGTVWTARYLHTVGSFDWRQATLPEASV